MDNDEFQKMVLLELKEIRKEQKNTCIEIAKQQTELKNHLELKDQESKSKREKLSYVIAGIGTTIAIISVFIRFLNL